MNKIPYYKVFSGVFILKENDSDKFIELLKRYDVEYYAGPIESTSTTTEVLAETKD
ncbi:MAG: hypothetical protein U9O96_03545 [Candidatus Thermoplasmatota archaeon]|nr:hypothetical protein [Candidatus Thermoplasmatota archaeon]